MSDRFPDIRSSPRTLAGATILQIVPASREVARMAALARGDRVIAPSVYAATPVIERHGIPREQVTIIPRAIDTALFDRRHVQADRIEVLRQTWHIAVGDRVVLTPGRVA